MEINEGRLVLWLFGDNVSGKLMIHRSWTPLKKMKMILQKYRGQKIIMRYLLHPLYQVYFGQTIKNKSIKSNIFHLALNVFCFASFILFIYLFYWKTNGQECSFTKMFFFTFIYYISRFRRCFSIYMFTLFYLYTSRFNYNKKSIERNVDLTRTYYSYYGYVLLHVS